MHPEHSTIVLTHKTAVEFCSTFIVENQAKSDYYSGHKISVLKTF